MRMNTESEISANSSNSVSTDNTDITSETVTDAATEAPLLDRNTYKSIKRMDKDTLQGLIIDIYENGRKKGLKEAGVEVISPDDDHTLDLRELEKSIRAVPGMGEKRTEAVMQIIEQWLRLE